MPTLELKHREERRAMGRLYIELTRAFRQAFKEIGKGGDFDGGLLLVAAAVVVGHADKRPMTASKIAHYIEVPRNTVVRKLQTLEDQGMIERRDTTYIVANRRAINFTLTVQRYVRVLEAAHVELKESPMRRP